MDAFGPTVDYFCQRQGIKLQELAEHIGVSRNTLTNWKAKGRPPNREITTKLARVLHLNEEETSRLLISAEYAPTYPVKEAIAPSPQRNTLESDKATSGTRRAYLHWLMERALYLDARDTSHIQHLAQVKLEDVYIGLSAQHEEAPGLVDRRLLENDAAGLEGRLATYDRATEENEDQGKPLPLRFDDRPSARRSIHAVRVLLTEAITQNARLVILGDPGSGKTTLLRYLALKHAHAQHDGQTDAGAGLGAAQFPILIRIADYAEHGLPQGKSLSDFLADDCSLHECPRVGLADLFSMELERGSCLVLLDGLDEVVSADERRVVGRQVEDFVGRYGDTSNRFVITSRVAGYRSAPLGQPFAHHTIEDMDEPQMRHFLERWCPAIETAQTPELSPEACQMAAKREIEGILFAVRTSPGVRRLAANPLLLRLLALIHRTSRHLPERRIELYRLAAEILAFTHRLAQGVSETALVKDEHLTPLLCTLAYWLHEHKPTGMASEREVLEILGEEWANLNDWEWNPDRPNVKIIGEVKAFLRQIREQTGLFIERAPQRYGFVHLTFEEYYAGRYLVALSKTRAGLIRRYLHQPRWDEPILLALGFVGLESPREAQALVETAILAEGEDAQKLGFVSSTYEEWLGRDFLFALRCLRDGIPIRPTVRKRLMERLVDELLHESGLAKFERYRKALEERLPCVRRSDTIVIPHLLTALHDRDAWIRARAAECLGLIGNASPEVFKALIAMLLQDTDDYVRYMVAHSLSRLHHGSPDAVIPPEFYSPEVFNAWVVALGIDPRSFERPKVKVTKEEFEARVALMLTEWAVALQQSADAQVRSRAARGLGSEGALAEEPWKVCYALITALQQDADAGVRAEAAASLSMGGGRWQEMPEVLAALVVALQQDAEANVRSSVLWSLEQLGNASPEVLAALVVALQQDSDRWVRSHAAVCLGRLGKASPEVLAALVVALQQDTETDVRSMAAWSLVQLRQVPVHQVESTLLEGIQDAWHPSIRSDCARLLGEMGQANELTQQALWHGLLDRYGYVRKACAQALVQVTQRFPEMLPSIVDKLIQSFADPAFNQLDAPEPDEPGTERPAYDYAYDALWFMMTGSEAEQER